jgi:phage gpG-like protein
VLTWTDATVNVLLRRIAAAVGPSRFVALWRVLRQLALSGVKEHFATSVGPDGVAYPGLVSRAGVPLRDKGLLMASVREAGAAPGLTLLSALRYAAAQQYGATIRQPERRRGRGEKPWVFQGRSGTVFTRHIRAHTIVLPARPFLGIGAATAAKMSTAAETMALRPTLEALRLEPQGVTRNARMREVLELLRIVRAGRFRPTGVKAA